MLGTQQYAKTVITTALLERTYLSLTFRWPGRQCGNIVDIRSVRVQHLWVSTSAPTPNNVKWHRGTEVSWEDDSYLAGQ